MHGLDDAQLLEIVGMLLHFFTGTKKYFLLYPILCVINE